MKQLKLIEYLLPSILLTTGLAVACGGATEGGAEGSNFGERLAPCSGCATDGAGDSDRDDPSDDPADQDGGTAGEPPPNEGPREIHGFAIYEKDMPPYDFGGTSGSSGGSGGVPGLDPDTLHLVIGTSAASCDEPRALVMCSEWSVRIPVPPHLQQPGTIQLSELNGGQTSAGDPYSDDPTDCSWGGGSFFDGTLTIVSIDAEHVAFELDQTWALDMNADGSYQVPRCLP